MSFLNQRQAGRAHESRQRMSGNEFKKTLKDTYLQSWIFLTK